MCLLCEKAPRCPIGNFEEEKRFECVCFAKRPQDAQLETSKRNNVLNVSALRKGSKIPKRELRRGKALLMCLLCEKAPRCPIGNFEEQKRFECVCFAKRPQDAR